MGNLEWVDKRNDVDDVNAEDINLIAHYVQELNKNVDEKFGDIEDEFAKKSYVEDEIDQALVDSKAYTDEKSSELSSAITTLENNEIECSSSGAVINIKDSAEVKPRGLKLYGKTEQLKTNGYNQLNLPYKYSFTQSVNLTNVCSLKAGIEYVFYYDSVSFSAESRGLAFAVIGVKNGTVKPKTPFKFTPTTDNPTMYMYSNGYDSGESAGITATVKGLRIYPSTADVTIYEPYSGGVASPSPEQPQALESIGDRGSVDVELYGKNLWDKDNPILETRKNSYDFYAIKVGAGNTVTYSYSQSIQSGVDLYVCVNTGTWTPEKPELWLYHKTVNSMTNKKGKITAGNTGIIYLGVNTDAVMSGTFMNLLSNYLQIEIDSEATEYEEYKKQSISISTPNGLLGIPVTSGGNYTDENGQQYICDEVDFNKGVYVHRIGEAILTGAEDWKCSDDNASFFTPHNNIFANMNLIAPMCSHFTSITTGIASTDNAVLINTWSIYISKHDLNGDVTAFKDLLKTLNPKVISILATPYETPLTDEEVEAYKSITMYKPVTNIFNSDNAQMKVDYVADTKTYIDNKFAELQNAIISTGGNV